MPGIRKQTDFPLSFFDTPSPVHRELFYTVLRAGHLRAAPGYGVKREHFHGYEFICCLSGAAQVRVDGRWHDVSSGDLVLFNCHHPHEHKTAAPNPWEAYWVRIEGPGLEKLCSTLSIGENPIIRLSEPASIYSTYQEIFKLMSADSTQRAPLLHAAVARLVALACCARQLPSPDNVAPGALRPVMDRLRLHYFEPHTVKGLAALAGLSPAHFNRLFRRSYGASPIDWLRRERISQAKRRLAETNDPVEWIAEQVGYRDRFFFSKDFKRITGLSPRDFRRRES